MRRQPLTRASEQDGASEVVGIALLFGFVLVAATFVFIAGSATLEDIRTETELDAAERNVKTANAELKSVASKPENATTDLRLGNANPSDVRVRRGTEITMTAIYDGGVENSTTVDVSAVVYTHEDGTKIVSQSGGVWRLTESGTSVVTQPALQYDAGALDFDLINTTGPVDSTGDRIRASRNGSESVRRTNRTYEQLLVDTDGDGEKDLPDTVRFEVDGRYERAWQHFFRSEYGDVEGVSVASSGAKAEFKLISTVESGTPTDGTTYSTTRFANRESQHVFEYTVQKDGLEGNWERIEIEYEGTPDLSAIDGNVDAVESIGVDTTNSGFLDTTSEVETVIEGTPRVRGSTVTIDIDPDTLPELEPGQTLMVRYGRPNGAPIVNPEADRDGVEIRAFNTSGNSDERTGDLNLRPQLDPIEVDRNGLLINGRDVTIRNHNTALEETVEKPGQQIPADVVIVSDESGSMDQNDPGGFRLDATDQFIEDLESAEADHRVATVHFSLWGDHVGCAGSTEFSPSDTDARVVNDLSDPSDVSATSQPDRCGTNYHAGLRQAMDLLESQSSEDRRKVIVFMGDGEHVAMQQYGGALDQYEYDANPTPGNIRKLAGKAQRRGISIHTIGFSNGLNAPGKQLLQNMTVGDGSYRFAESPEDLKPAFREIVDDVTEPTRKIDHRAMAVTAIINGDRYTFDDSGGELRTGTGAPSGNRALFDPTVDPAPGRVPGNEIPSKPQLFSGDSVQLSLRIKDYGCEDPEPTGETVTAGSKTYDVRVCQPERGDTPVDTIEPTDDSYHVLTAENTADDLDDLDVETGFWQQDLETALDEEGYLSNGTLDIDDDVAVIVAEPDSSQLDEGYVLFTVNVGDAVRSRVGQTPLAPGNDRLFSISIQEVELDE